MTNVEILSHSILDNSGSTPYHICDMTDDIE